MPTTPDRPSGSAESPNDRADAEALALASRPTDQVIVEHPTVPVGRPTTALDDAALGRRETVTVPGPRRPVAPPPGRAPLAVAAGFATLWAALWSYVPVFVVVGLARTLEGAGGLGGAARAGLAGWLLGHGVAIGTSIGSLGLAPLLLTLLIVWRLNRAGVHVTRAIGARRGGSIRSALAVAGMIGLWYAVIGLLAALVTDAPGTAVPNTAAAVDFFLLGLAGALIGTLRSTDALGTIARRIPRMLRHGLRTGVVAALLILVAGAVVTGLSVALGAGRAADMIAAYHTGVAGQAGITLLSLAYGVNAIVWAAAYLLGPGFALGTGTAVRLTEVSVGPLPTVPLLAGLPDGPTGAAGAALLAVPVVAAIGSGVLMTRRMSRPRPSRPGEPPAPRRSPSWVLVVGSAVIAGPVAGLVLGLLAWISGGSLGDGRLSDIGPGFGAVLLAATVVVTVGASLGAAAARAFRSPG